MSKLIILVLCVFLYFVSAYIPTNEQLLKTHLDHVISAGGPHFKTEKINKRVQRGENEIYIETDYTVDGANGKFYGNCNVTLQIHPKGTPLSVKDENCSLFSVG